MSKCNPPYNNANYKAPRMQFAIDSQLDKAQKKPYLDVELQEMLKDGAVLAYHSTDQKYKTFENPQIGFHFAANKELAHNAAVMGGRQNPFEIEFKLGLKKPLTVTDPPANGWYGGDVLDRLLTQGVISEKEHNRSWDMFEKYEDQSNNYEITEATFDKRVSKMIKNLLASKGFDSIKYWNTYDAGYTAQQLENMTQNDKGDYLISGEPIAPDWSYIVFDNKQIERKVKSNSNKLTPFKNKMLKDGETLAYHGSDASNIKEFELGRSSKNTSMLPQGIYTTSDERESADFGGTVYPVGVTQGNVFDMTNSSSNKITPAMVDAYREALFNAGYRGDWAEGLVSDFKKTGEMKIGISPSDKSKVYIAGGYDTLKDGSRHLISLNPKNARILGSTDSESVRDKFAKRDIRKADRVEERKRKKQWYNKPGILKPFDLSDLTT